MELSEAFNGNYRPELVNSSTLQITYAIGSGYSASQSYDFVTRIMITRSNYNGAFAVTPFSLLDRETLVTMRDKLVALGGTPPELPAEAPAASSPAKKLNL